MPKGSLIPEEVKGKLSLVQKVVPPEIAKQIKILANAERSFVIPIKLSQEDKVRYLIVAGILLKDKVNASPSFDEEDLELLGVALDKAKKALGQIDRDEKDEGVDENDDTENEESGEEGNEQ